MDSFVEGPQTTLCYLYFVLATLITNITMLNMLIAIMGDTFENNMENKHVNGIKAKLDLMSDLAGVIDESEQVSMREAFKKIDESEQNGIFENDYSGFLSELVEIAAALLGRRRTTEAAKEIYLFVAQPTGGNENDNEDGWDGSIKRLSNIIQDRHNQLNKDVKDYIFKAVNDNQLMIDRMTTDLKTEISKIRDDLTKETSTK